MVEEQIINSWSPLPLRFNHTPTSFEAWDAMKSAGLRNGPKRYQGARKTSLRELVVHIMLEFEKITKKQCEIYPVHHGHSGRRRAIGTRLLSTSLCGLSRLLRLTVI